MQAAYFASKGRLDLARVLADHALGFARNISVSEQDKKSAADCNLIALLTEIQNAGPTPMRGLKPSWGTGSFSFRIQLATAALAITLVLALSFVGPRTIRTAQLHVAGWDVLGEAPVARGVGIEGISNTAPLAPFNYPTQPLPRTGPMHVLPRYVHAAVAPLKIVSPNDGQNYYIKLVDWTTHARVVLFFLRSVELLSAEVPVGQYEILYACGKTWYGEEYRFGPDTEYRKADARLDFEQQGNKVAGYRLDLIKRIDGNLKEVKITSSEFGATSSPEP